MGRTSGVGEVLELVVEGEAIMEINQLSEETVSERVGEAERGEWEARLTGDLHSGVRGNCGHARTCAFE